MFGATSKLLVLCIVNCSIKFFNIINNNNNNNNNAKPSGFFFVVVVVVVVVVVEAIIYLKFFNLQDVTFKTREKTFDSSFSICITVTLNEII